MAKKKRQDNVSVEEVQSLAGSPRQPRAIKSIIPRNENQRKYFEAIENNAITIGYGPAGSGKTWLAVYQALRHQFNKEAHMKRIIITRPAVEAGEKLGFLPGSLEEKVDPYMRPIYDALYDFIGMELTKQKIERGYIEIAPIAYLRGRAQPLYSPVLTPSGFVKMGDLKIDDYVVNSKGLQSKISDIFPQGVKDTYRIYFTDGTSTECTEDHLWLTRTRSEKKHLKGFTVKDTKEIMSTLRVGKGQCNHEIPVLSSPVEFSYKETPIDPYLLGVLLGDGTISTGTISITNVDPDLWSLVENAMPDGMYLYEKSDKISRNLCSPGGSTPNPILDALRDLKLRGCKSHDKFIPELYKLNSTNIRLAVLQGLMDTDGCVMDQKSGKNSRVQFYTKSEKLADDVRFLVQSLGGTSTKLLKKVKGQSHIWNGRKIEHKSDCFILDFRLPEGFQPFRLTRKKNKFRKTAAPLRLISKVEYVGKTECQCISVESNDHLYLTDSLILTHNTFKDCFIIVDEAQNATLEQLKMVVTRMGENSKMVINGDPGQTDLPKGKDLGLRKLAEIVRGVENVAVVPFGRGDIVRSQIVVDLVTAFETYEEAHPNGNGNGNGNHKS